MGDVTARSKAYDSFADSTKQILTLSTGVATLSATFLSNFLDDAKAPKVAKDLLAASWVFMGLAIVAGLITLNTIVGNLDKLEDGTPLPALGGPGGSNTTLISLIQWLLFVGGLALALTAAGYGSLSGHRPDSTPSKPTTVVCVLSDHCPIAN